MYGNKTFEYDLAFENACSQLLVPESHSYKEKLAEFNDLRGWEWYRLRHIADQSRMTLRAHGDCVGSIAFSPDGRRIVSGSDDKTIKIWDAATGAELMTLRGHGRGISLVAFRPDGKCIVSSSADNTIKVWNSATGAEVMTLRGHKYRITSVAISPDGKRIASGCGDNTIKIWDAATGTELMTIHGRGFWHAYIDWVCKRVRSCQRRRGSGSAEIFGRWSVHRCW